MAKRGPTKMSNEHKAALAAGRVEGRAVRNYLEALAQRASSRGRSRSAESIARRLQRIDEELTSADAIERLGLVQERRDLQRQLEALQSKLDMDALEAEFVKVARGYSERKGIEYASWREVGVPASVLKAAGVQR